MYVFSTPGHPVLDTNFAIASCLFSMKCPQQSPLPLPNSGKKLFILKEKPKIPIFDETEYSKHLTRNFFTYPKFSKFSFCTMDFLRSASKYPSPLSIHLIHTFPTDVRSHSHSTAANIPLAGAPVSGSWSIFRPTANQLHQYNKLSNTVWPCPFLPKTTFGDSPWPCGWWLDHPSGHFCILVRMLLLDGSNFWKWWMHGELVCCCFAGEPWPIFKLCVCRIIRPDTWYYRVVTQWSLFALQWSVRT